LGVVRTLAAATVLLLSCAASADRLVLIPTGKKLLSETFQLEILTDHSRDITMGWVGLGLGQSFDVEVTGESFDDNRMVNSVDFSYNYTVPIVDFAPGISFGVQDAMNVTERGRNLYMAVTYRFGNYGELNQDIPTELTFGFWSRAQGVLFAGVRLPFSETFSVLAEHDSENLTAGIELSPHEGVAFKALFRQDQVMLSFRVQSRF
jgi:hypothetical protein